VRVAPPELEVPLGADDEAGSQPGEGMQTLKVP
jgi:hypothetical protein